MPVLGESDRSNIMQQRAKEFKNRGVSADDLRTRRRETNVELRKKTRDEQLLKRRRNVGAEAEEVADGETELATTAETEASMAALVQGVFSADPSQHFAAAQGIRKTLSKQRDPPIEMVISTGVVPRLVEFMSPTYDNETDVQLEAAWSLTNIASGTSDQTRTVVEAGAVPNFVRLLKSPNMDLAEQCVWALGNIAGDSPALRDYVLECNIMGPLLELLQNCHSIKVIRNAAWALSNLCRGKSPQPPFTVVRNALPTLARLIFSNDQDIIADSAWTLSYLSDGDEQKIDSVLAVGVTRRLVELLMHNSSEVVTPSLRCLGNIVTGNALQTQTVINCGALQFLLPLLSHTKENIRKESCWAVSNITAGTVAQIQTVIDHNIVPVLLEILKVDTFRTRKEACWAVANFICGGSDEQVKYIVKQGCIKPLVDALNLDAGIVKVTLDAFDRILRVGEKEAVARGGVNEYATFLEEADGLDVIEKLQDHEKVDVYERARDLLLRWFPGDDDIIDHSGVPLANENQFVFGAPHGAPQGGFQF